MRKLLTIILMFFTVMAGAQFGMRQNTDGFVWNANWIGVPDAGQSDPGVYLFRKTLNLETVPVSFEIYVTADNRYKLYVNERLVSLGPALGDIENWNYETVNLAPFLKAGENIISAKVWNEGSLKPVSQISLRTGFMLQGANEESQVLNTDDTWKCIRDNSYTFIPQTVTGYYAAGAGERIDMHPHIQGWESITFDDSGWEHAAPLFGNTQGRRFGGLGIGGGGARWTLQPSVIPQMEMTMLRLQETRRAEGVTVPRNFPAQKAMVNIPANTTATILLDQTYYVNAYPTLIFSGGNNSVITITYAEALYGEGRAKDNRNEIEGKTMFGRQDTLISNGSDRQEFTPLDWRTYRYVELKIETRETPLVIDDFYGTYTGYPFEMKAKLESGNPEIEKIMEVGWRTARSCAVETYMDCPYYERLQYIGDARIQMIVSYYNTGDDRLAKNALNLMDQSRQRDGVTTSRYPDNQRQIIAPYSLWYVSMLHDYLIYGADKDFLSDKVLGWRQILNYFLSRMDDGSLKNIPGWNFTDWADDWRNQMGTGPFGEDGSSSVLDLQLLLALQSAQALEEIFGDRNFAELYGNIAKELSETIQEKYWDDSKNLFADTPEKDKFSQHANSMAILAGLAEGDKAKKIGELMLSDESLTQASIYFRYYLHLALNEAGLGDGYLDWLDDWRKNIELGMTTYGEDSNVENTRSDCHAWGASPNIEFYRIMLGIDSDAPYFEKVKIEPNLGSIKKVNGEIPHPSGKISVSYDNSGSNLKAEITLPENVPGIFIWKGKSYDLVGGRNTINVE